MSLKSSGSNWWGVREKEHVCSLFGRAKRWSWCHCHQVQTTAVWTNSVKNKAGESKWSFYSGHNETEFNNIRPFLHLVRITIKSQKIKRAFSPIKLKARYDCVSNHGTVFRQSEFGWAFFTGIFTQTSWFLMPYYRKTVKRKMFEYMRYVQTHVSEWRHIQSIYQLRSIWTII